MRKKEQNKKTIKKVEKTITRGQQENFYLKKTSKRVGFRIRKW